MIKLKKGLVPFWSDELIDTRFTDATLSANRPEKRDVVLTCDRDYEGNATDFFTILKDDDRYRMYYEGWGLEDKPLNIRLCYAESSDGLNWEKPDLYMVE